MFKIITFVFMVVGMAILTMVMIGILVLILIKEHRNGKNVQDL
ncbi:MAG: hypothetical protein RLZ10_2787 [Bacteroidota bacterium]|jgi:hypothetical protein